MAQEVAVSETTLPFPFPCRLSSWAVGAGDKVCKGSLLGSCVQSVGLGGGGGGEGEKEATLQVKSSVVGVVKELLFAPGDVIQPGNVMVKVEKRCQHNIVVFDMCADCGLNLRNKPTSCSRGSTSPPVAANIMAIHDNAGIKISQQEAEVLALKDKLRLLRTRKLTLVADLDQTLIHTSTDPHIEPGLPDVYRFRLGGHPVVYHCRLRPHVRQFLNKISKLYELHVFTMATKDYAAAVIDILDPEKRLFCDRIITRDEFFDPRSKAFRFKSVFPCGDSMVAIIDDREDVWGRCPNLVHVKPYVFFSGTSDINAPPPLIHTPSPHSSALPATPTVPRPFFRGTEGGVVPQGQPRPFKMRHVVGRGQQRQSSGQPALPSSVSSHSLTAAESNGRLALETRRDTEASASGVQENSSATADMSESRSSAACESEGSSAAAREEESDHCKASVGVSLPIKNCNNSNNNSNKDKKKDGATESDDTGGGSGDDGEGETGDCDGGEGGRVENGRKEKEVSNSSSSGSGSGSDDSSSSGTSSDMDDSQPQDAVVRPPGESERVKNSAEAVETLPTSATSDTSGKNTVISAEVEVTATGTRLVTAELSSKQANEDKSEKRNVKIEDADSFLLYLGDVLERIHTTFYHQLSESLEDRDLSEMVDVPTPDLKTIIPEIRQSVLRGAKILFTGVIPTNIPPQRSPIWNTARAFGAVVHDRLVPGLGSTRPRAAMRATTHVIAGKPGTAKLKEARRVPGVKIVSPRWVWSCAEQWKWLNEGQFPVESEEGGGGLARRERPSRDKQEIKRTKVAQETKPALKEAPGNNQPPPAEEKIQPSMSSSEKSRTASRLDSRLSVSDEELELMEAEVEAEMMTSSSSSSEEESGGARQSLLDRSFGESPSSERIVGGAVGVASSSESGRKRKHVEVEDSSCSNTPQSNSELPADSGSGSNSSSSDEDDALAALLADNST